MAILLRTLMGLGGVGEGLPEGGYPEMLQFSSWTFLHPPGGPVFGPRHGHRGALFYRFLDPYSNTPPK